LILIVSKITRSERRLASGFHSQPGVAALAESRTHLFSRSHAHLPSTASRFQRKDAKTQRRKGKGFSGGPAAIAFCEPDGSGFIRFAPSRLCVFALKFVSLLNRYGSSVSAVRATPPMPRRRR